jgi:hypothetical protein
LGQNYGNEEFYIVDDTTNNNWCWEFIYKFKVIWKKILLEGGLDGGNLQYHNTLNQVHRARLLNKTKSIVKQNKKYSCKITF